MRTKKTFLYKESNKDLIITINKNTNLLKTEVLSIERKEEIVYNVQSLQNELNFRLLSYSTWIVKILSLITIALTMFTIILSILTIYSDNKTQNNQQLFQKNEINLLENILNEMKKFNK
jgi:hypothetical protein